MKKKYIKNWMRNSDRDIQNIVATSDVYAEIEDITELKLNFKLVPIAGSGYIFVK